MTPTAKELYNSIPLTRKRLYEQGRYISELIGRKREMRKERFEEISESAFFVAESLFKRLKELENVGVV